MPINLTVENLNAFLRVSAPQPTFPPRPVSSGPMANGALTRFVSERVAELQATFLEIEALVTTANTGTTLSTAAAHSVDRLGLNNVATSTVLRSTGEINATPTSFSPFGPVISGTSTALPTLDGVYDGSNGTETLTFDVKKGGVHGQDKLQLKVTDSLGNPLDTIDVAKNDPIDEEYTLSNGLVFTLSAGTLVKDDTFTVDVFADVGSAVDPDKPFDGTRNDRPNFEYGVQVGAGSFEVNGVSIAVNADDSINAVLARINGSGAGVVAAFDTATEAVVLTHEEPGSAHHVSVANDTSGFLAAMKLAGAVAEPGQDRDADMPLAQTQAFASVQSGTLTVNGVGIAVDVDVDSLSDIVARIDASVSGVTASLIHDGQRVLLRAELAGTVLDIDDGGTGLFPALDISPGLYKGKEHGAGLSRTRSYEVADAIQRAELALNELFTDALLPARPDAGLERLREDLRRAIEAGLAGGGEREAGRIGLDFLLDRPAGVSVLSVDRGKLTGALQNRLGAVQDFLFVEARSGETGLVDRLRIVLGTHASSQDLESGSVGLLLDTFA